MEVRRREEEEDSWGISNLFWYVVAGGQQCCSMRDRTKPADMEAAKTAAETGRPPSRFPEPPGRGGPLDNAFERGGRDKPSLYAEPERGGGMDRGRSAPPRPIEGSLSRGRQQQYHHQDDEESEEEEGARYRAQADRPVSSYSGWGGQNTGSSKLGPKGSNSTDPLMPGGSWPSQPSQDSPPPGAAGRGGGGGPASVGTELPKRWEWPSWCLNFKSPCIEVYVVDDDTGIGKWVEAEPQSRVVDKAGRDAYLCVEYEWDGEYYVQDFGPQHVRRRGQAATVFEIFEQNRARADTGGGLSAFLD